jgi:16S rRNA (guanine(966)-N(2))-methyltransferase RsmD
MRVIGGEFRSRPLKSAPGLDTRPTPDRLREALFNVLAPRIEGKLLVDAYAGTGAVGIEALSRGARRAVFIERSKKALAVLRENLDALDLGARAQVVQGKVTLWLDKFEADIVFLDPPYELEREYAASLELLGARPPELVIAQHASRLKLGERYGALKAYRTLKQGDNSLTFYSAE